MSKLRVILTNIKLFIKNMKKVIKVFFECSRGTVAILIILSIVLGLIVPLEMFIWKRFLDETTIIILDNKFSSVDQPIFWIFMHCICVNTSTFILRYLDYSKKMYTDYLNKYISNLMMMKVCEIEPIYFDNSEIYDNIQKINNESVMRISNILDVLISIFKNTTIFLGTISIISTFDTSIVFLCIVGAIPMFVVSLRILSEQFEIYNKRIENLRLVLYLKEMFIKNENIKEIKIYNAGIYLKDKILNIYEKYIKEDKKIRRRFLRNITISEVMDSFISYVLKIYVLLKTKYNGIGDLVMFFNSMDRLQSSVSTILDTLSSLYESNLYIESLFKLLELDNLTNTETIDAKLKFDRAFKSIEFKNVWFKYTNCDEFVLKNINLSIECNRVYSLVGLNGSGKTTLIKLLTGLYEPTKGEIYIDGINIKRYDKKSIYKNIAVVFQDFIKFPLDVKTNIGLGAIENIDNIEVIRESAKKSGAHKFIQKLPNGYKTRLQREWSNGVDLSLGQWQKIAISRAIVNDAQLLVLDEPTASLDPLSEYELFTQFKDMVENKTAILISHRFSTVKLADYIIVIKEGQIVEEGSHKELIELDGEYSTLYNTQAESYIK